MSRIINVGDTPAKRRNVHRRSCAEVLRLLARHPSLASSVFDEEARDMTAFLVFSLRGIEETIETSAQAWDDRNYWKKSEKLRADWRWSRQVADHIESLMLEDCWNEIPQALIDLVSRFQSVTITKMMRDSDWWVGAYGAMVKKAQKQGARA